MLARCRPRIAEHAARRDCADALAHELVAERRQVADEAGPSPIHHHQPLVEREDHRGLELAGVPAGFELADAEGFSRRKKRAVIDVPVRASEDAATGVLAHEVVDDPGERHRVAAVARIDEHVAKAVLEEAVAPVSDGCMQRLVLDRDRAGKGHVMVGAANRDQRSDERRQALRHALQHRHRVQGIGRQRQVGAVLLGRPYQQDDAVDTACDRVGDLGRSQFRQTVGAKPRQFPLLCRIDVARRASSRSDQRRISQASEPHFEPICNRSAHWFHDRPLGRLTCR